jgi:hypothetical protein
MTLTLAAARCCTLLHAAAAAAAAVSETSQLLLLLLHRQLLMRTTALTSTCSSASYFSSCSCIRCDTSGCSSGHGYLTCNNTITQQCQHSNNSVLYGWHGGCTSQYSQNLM